MEKLLNSLKKFIDDKAGASSVVGVILVIGVTVILAAVVGGYVYSISNDISESPPNTQFEIDYIEDYEYTDPHDSGTIRFDYAVEIIPNGDNIDPKNIDVKVNGEQAYVAGPTEDPEAINDPEITYPSSWDSGHRIVLEPWQLEDTISTGEKIRILTAGPEIRDYPANVTPINEDRVLYRHNYMDVYINDGGGSNPDLADVMLNRGDTIEIIWSSGDESHRLAEYTI